MIDKYEFSCLEQGSDEWKKARLGYFSGSQIGNLMKSGKAGKEFSDTAMSYIYEVASKRNYMDYFLDDADAFLMLKDRIEISNKAMRYGTDNEPLAREMYEVVNNCKVSECGFILHPTIEWWGDSPDGYVINDKDIITRVVEFKCPDSKTFIKYKYLLSQGMSLKEVMPDYYWQCLNHLIISETAEACDFVVFDAMQKNGYYQTSIILTEEICKDMDLLTNKVIKANEIINNILKDDTGEHNQDKAVI